MNKAQTTGQTLALVRQEIDSVDDGILELLARRFELVEQVKALKQSRTDEPQIPLRPAREAEVLRRLVKKGELRGVHADLLVRLWPAIFCDASLRQGPLSLHVTGAIFQSQALRFVLRDYFPFVAVQEHDVVADVMKTVLSASSEIAAVEPEGDWARSLPGTPAVVIAALPFLSKQSMPRLLVIGQNQSQATGDDETLVLSKGSLPRDFAVKPKWSVLQSEQTLTALQGYLSEKEPPLQPLIRANPRLQLKVIGRYPSPMKIAP
jgi:chorismate mutase